MADINKLNAIARQAGKIIMGHYNPELVHQFKEDDSPVTKADIEANEYIVGQLAANFPDIPIISEEGAKDAQHQGTFFLVDPLDGTKEFIKKTGHFTVNIGLVKNYRAHSGVIYAPVSDIIYYTDGTKAFKDGDEIKCRQAPLRGLVAVASKSHSNQETNDFIETLNVTKRISAGSSLKFCLVAEGIADIYPRFGRTMEWDTAAGHAILNAAGGSVTTMEGKEFLYAKNEIWENPYFIARGLV